VANHLPFLLVELSVLRLLDALGLKDIVTSKRWQTGKTTPNLEQKRVLLVLYGAFNV